MLYLKYTVGNKKRKLILDENQEKLYVNGLIKVNSEIVERKEIGSPYAYLLLAITVFYIVSSITNKQLPPIRFSSIKA